MHQQSLQELEHVRERLEQLHHAISAAGKQGDIQRDVWLTLKACQLRRRLLQMQAQAFEQS